MPNIGFVEPPRMARRRKSSLNDSAVERMAELLDNKDNKWVSDNETYQEKRKAIARAQAYRRQTANVLDLDMALIKSRVWETEGGKYAFALRRELS
jgi:hypothetical protein